MNVLVTGCAGFIGSHVARSLISRGDNVVGIDNLNDYYEVSLKKDRLEFIESAREDAWGSFKFVHGDIADSALIGDVFGVMKFDRVINLAAQAGVRYSLENPATYIQSNVVGFANILEACRHHKVGHLTYASTSSVYGANTTMPFNEEHGVDHPVQLYAATKRSNELMAHSYSHLFGLPTTGLRFFTVYGPWGRPDMALFKFTKNIIEGRPIPVFNYGDHSRDFTYIDDIVSGVIRSSDAVATPNLAWSSDKPEPCSSQAPFRIYNIGNGRPVKLTDYIDALEDSLGMEAHRDLLPPQPGDVKDTFADSSRLSEATGYSPSTPVTTGVSNFVEWYRSYYKI